MSELELFKIQNLRIKPPFNYVVFALTLIYVMNLFLEQKKLKDQLLKVHRLRKGLILPMTFFPFFAATTKTGFIPIVPFHFSANDCVFKQNFLRIFII